MAQFFNRLSIRYKLVVLLGLSTGAGLLLSALLIFYSTWQAEKNSSLATLQQLASIASENMRAALAFHDAESAEKILSSLRAHPHILMGTTLNEKNESFAGYRASHLKEAESSQIVTELARVYKAENFKNELKSKSVKYIGKEWHYIIVPIYLNDDYLGLITLVANNDLMFEKMQRFAWMQIMVTAIIGAAILLLSFYLQKIFANPILTLIEAMKNIGENKDYKNQLETSRVDEFKELYQGFNAMMQAIAERDHQLSLLANTDALTGLFNRRYALENLATMIVRSQRKKEYLSVILLDIDFFKKINDNYGHPGGDKALQELAGILNKSARSYDLIARFGGEEFLIICDNANPEVALIIAERIRTMVESHQVFLQDGRTLKMTVSLGLYSAVVPEGLTAEAMLEKFIDLADQALYRAKANGRNRVEAG